MNFRVGLKYFIVQKESTFAGRFLCMSLVLYRQVLLHGTYLEAALGFVPGSSWWEKKISLSCDASAGSSCRKSPSRVQEGSEQSHFQGQMNNPRIQNRTSLAESLKEESISADSSSHHLPAPQPWSRTHPASHLACGLGQVLSGPRVDGRCGMR